MQKAIVGQNISILFYVDDKPVAVNGTVTALEPFCMKSTDPSAAWLEECRRAMLIARWDNEFSKAEADLSAEKSGTGWNIVAREFGWEQVDRRRYPRFNISLGATLRAVIESDGCAELKYIEAITEDLSLGGAWLKTDENLPSDILVEFQVQLPDGKNLRILSNVKWSNTAEKSGIGVEFIDFLSGSRQQLQLFFSKAA
ncbi:MAG: PilZ domain-containing protein [Fimbriimonadaceae bacterium]